MNQVRCVNDPFFAILDIISLDRVPKGYLMGVSWILEGDS